ncbi:MAG: hypothetical protein M1823_004349 [Watsoniomyces obsoletus]|nr:MAG: hypothetical protein M1823_004349 [Watsoniomyces obsoletus]
MKSLLLFTTSLLLPFAVQAHYRLLYPVARTTDTKPQGTGPCGGANTPVNNRTQWSTQGGNIRLNMGHDRVLLQVLLGLGNDPGNNFNITLVPTVEQEGLGAVCLRDVRLPAGLQVAEGTNATVQVITSNERGGGLYSCADIQFSPSAQDTGECTNNTGVRISPITGAMRNANESRAAQTSGPSGSSATASATAAARTGSAASRQELSWVMGMGGLAMSMFGYAVLL